MNDHRKLNRSEVDKPVIDFRTAPGVRPASASRPKLPPALQNIVARNWCRLEQEIQKEELITAVECFSRYLRPEPIVADPQKAEQRAQAIMAAVRELGEGSEFFQMFCLEDEQEMRYRCRLLIELFERALTRLDKRQQQIIRLGKNAGLSFAKIAQEMGFASLAEVKVFYHTTLQTVLGLLHVLLNDELLQPGVEAQRRTAVKAWHALFARTAAVPILAKLLTVIPAFMALYSFTAIRLAGVA